MTRIRDIARIIGRSREPNINKVHFVTNVPIDSAEVTRYYQRESTPIVAYDSIGVLPTSGLTLGDRAFVKTDSNNARFYISNGSGWYNTALFNTSPSITLDSDSYSIDSDDGTTVITVSDSDFDQANLLAPTIAFIPANITDSAVNTSISGDTITLSLKDTAAGVYDAKIIVSRSDGNAIATDSADLDIILQQISSLTRSASSINEGSSVTFTLNTVGYDDGTTFDYTITGIQSADISGNLTGTMTVSNNAATATITATSDQITEGNQTMTFSVDDTNLSTTCTILDTSKTPSYTFTSSSSSVNEGSSVTWTLSSTNHPGGNVSFTRSGATNDGTWSISSGSVSSNYFSVPAGNSTRTLTFTATADNTSEGSETVTVACKGYTRAVTINDTSTGSATVTNVATTTLSGGTVSAQPRFDPPNSFGTEDANTCRSLVNGKSGNQVSFYSGQNGTGTQVCRINFPQVSTFSASVTDQTCVIRGASSTYAAPTVTSTSFTCKSVVVSGGATTYTANF